MAHPLVCPAATGTGTLVLWERLLCGGLYHPPPGTLSLVLPPLAFIRDNVFANVQRVLCA